jgi:hypothetical protein
MKSIGESLIVHNVELVILIVHFKSVIDLDF